MEFKTGSSLRQLLQTTYLTDIVKSISQMPEAENRISAMHHLLTLIKTDGAAAIKTLCDRYAPNYSFTPVNGRFLVLNSELLA
jgi:hypothetical protein